MQNIKLQKGDVFRYFPKRGDCMYLKVAQVNKASMYCAVCEDMYGNGEGEGELLTISQKQLPEFECAAANFVSAEFIAAAEYRQYRQKAEREINYGLNELNRASYRWGEFTKEDFARLHALYTEFGNLLTTKKNIR